MKLIEKIKLNNKIFKVYKINYSEVSIFKKLHYNILKDTPKEFDSPFNYSSIKKGIENKRSVVFLVYYRQKPVAYSFMSLAEFREKNVDYTKRYKVKENQLPFVVDFYGSGVLKNYRGNSLQDYLLKLRERYAINLGFKYFYISSDPKNKYSLANIMRNGFTEKLYEYKNEDGYRRYQLRKKIDVIKQVNIFPKNKNYFLNILEFNKKIKNIFKKLKIIPIVYGSFAYFCYLKNPNEKINDIDYLVDYKYFTNIFKELDKQKINYSYSKKWKSITIKQDNFKIEIDDFSIIPKINKTHYNKVDFNDYKFNIVSFFDLLKIYSYASKVSKDKPKENLRKVYNLKRI